MSKNAIFSPNFSAKTFVKSKHWSRENSDEKMSRERIDVTWLGIKSNHFEEMMEGYYSLLLTPKSPTAKTSTFNFPTDKMSH
jgi:hypothetical protein